MQALGINNLNIKRTMATLLSFESMDTEFTLYPFIIFMIVLFIAYNLKARKPARLPLPPGPPKLPLIGNMDKLLGSALHVTLRDLAKTYGPIMHLKLGFVSTVFVSSAEAAKEFMKVNDAVFSNRPKLLAPGILEYNYTGVAFAPYSPYWRQMRRVCVLELLSSKRVSSFRSVREEQVSLLIRKIASDCSVPINVPEALFAVFHSIVSNITIGCKFEDKQLRFRNTIKASTDLAGGFHVGDFFPSLSYYVGVITGMQAKIEKNFQELDGMLQQIIQEHVASSKMKNLEHEDMIDVLLRLKDTEALEIPLTFDNIKAVVLDMLIGGTESSSNIVEWAMTELIRNLGMMKKAQAEVRGVVGGKTTVEESDLESLPYLKMIIKETLRYHPPAPFLLPRESMDKCTINGYEIPAKTRVFINYWAISRDPLSWENPNMFDPERFAKVSTDFKGQDFELIPFGSGRRVCPGISFGYVNTEIVFASLLYHFDWNLPNGLKPEDLDTTETFGMSLYKTNSLHLIPTLRFPVPI